MKSLVALFLGFLLSFNVFALKIIETSDIHGAFFQKNLVTGELSDSSLSKISSFIKNERKKDHDLLLLENGDIIQGTPVVYLKPDLLLGIYYNLKYDVATIGNHDFDKGQKVWSTLNKKMDWLCANAVDKITQKPIFTPYKIIRKDNKKIAILGMITDDMPKITPSSLYPNVEFKDPILTAKKYMQIIQKKERPDLIVGLFHIGADFSILNESSASREHIAHIIAQKVPGFDIVFTGHDHKDKNQLIKNIAGKDVLIIGPRNDAKSFAEVEVLFNSNGTKSINSKLIETNKLPIDTQFEASFQKPIKEVEQLLAKKISKIDSEISYEDSFFGSSFPLEILHKVQMNYEYEPGKKVDISFVAIPQQNGKIAKGDFYYRDTFSLIKYENFLYVLGMTGLEIKNFLEFSYANWLNTMKTEEDHVLAFKEGFESQPAFSRLKGAFYNYDSAFGINYTVDVTQPIGERITIKNPDGSAFDLYKKYKVAMNSYRGSGGGGHLEKGAKIPQSDIAKRLIHSSKVDIRDLLIEYLQKNQNVTYEHINNWEIIPANFVNKAKTKDIKYLK